MEASMPCSVSWLALFACQALRQALAMFTSAKFLRRTCKTAHDAFTSTRCSCHQEVIDFLMHMCLLQGGNHLGFGPEHGFGWDATHTSGSGGFAMISDERIVFICQRLVKSLEDGAWIT
jgi:hypothetical protein